MPTPHHPTHTSNPPRDATADFMATLNDPTRWVVKSSVPVFKPHQRTDPATGQLIKVDLPKLYRIAANLQRMEKASGVPVRLTLGHTEPGKPETAQPPVGGYYRNARVQPFGPNGEPAVVMDEWLDPQYAPARKNYPYRSAEYYDDSEQITGVALLTRDPFLDLGVVAYSRLDRGRGVTVALRGPTLYRADGSRRPAYQYLLGDATMWPQQGTNQPAGPPPAAVPVVPPQYAAPVQQQAQVQPTPYAAPAGQPLQYNSWEEGGYNPRQTIPHQHPSEGAVYAHPQAQGRRPAPPRGRYPTYNAEFPPGGPGDDFEGGLSGGMPSGGVSGGLSGGMPSGGMSGGMPSGGLSGGLGDDDSGLHALHHHLGQAVQHLSRYLTGRRANRYAGGEFGAPPDGPLPAGPAGAAGAGAPGMPGMGGPPTMPGMGGYSRGPRRYSRASAAQPGTTISGLPVGYQMKVDQLQYQLNESNRALQVLMYERDQADTKECVAEIRRLAAMGFDVGEFEVGELKKRRTDERDAYLQHITTKYARVPVGTLPAILGDPSPEHLSQNQAGRAATQDEVEQALRMTADDPSPTAYHQALHYIRSGGQAAPGAGRPFGDPYPDLGQNGEAR